MLHKLEVISSTTQACWHVEVNVYFYLKENAFVILVNCLGAKLCLHKPWPDDLTKAGFSDEDEIKLFCVCMQGLRLSWIEYVTERVCLRRQSSFCALRLFSVIENIYSGVNVDKAFNACSNTCSLLEQIFLFFHTNYLIYVRGLWVMTNILCLSCGIYIFFFWAIIFFFFPDFKDIFLCYAGMHILFGSSSPWYCWFVLSIPNLIFAMLFLIFVLVNWSWLLVF